MHTSGARCRGSCAVTVALVLTLLNGTGCCSSCSYRMKQATHLILYGMWVNWTMMHQEGYVPVHCKTPFLDEHALLRSTSAAIGSPPISMAGASVGRETGDASWVCRCTFTMMRQLHRARLWDCSPRRSLDCMFLGEEGIWLY